MPREPSDQRNGDREEPAEALAERHQDGRRAVRGERVHAALGSPSSTEPPRAGNVARRTSASDEWEAIMTVRVYEAEGLQVLWDSQRCVHVAACIRALPAVFNPTARPWVRMANGSTEEI